MANKNYDYIIVGTGAAGSIMASRLGADRTLRILVIEAGPSDRSIYVKMPAAMGYPITNPRRTWDFSVGPEPGLDDKVMSHVRGRMLGGSTSLNGMVFVRGNRRDYDGWAAAGLPDWGYEQCLPYFKRLETYGAQESFYRGASGPIRVTTLKGEMPVFQAFLDAGMQAGLPLNPDYNAEEQDGLHRGQASIDRGIRASTSRQYLIPALARGNIDLKTNATVQKVIFSGRRAVGVSYARNGRLRTVHAEREVILCGGAMNSPHLLQLSGVGAPDDLKDHAIPLVAAVPGVGKGLQDHVSSWVRYRGAKPGMSPAINLGPIDKLRIGLEWLLFRKGLGTTHLWEVGAFFKSSEAADYCDIQHEFLPMITGFSDKEVTVEEGFQYLVCLMRPESRGSVTLKSLNPSEHPKIVFNYLSAGQDRRTLMDAIRMTDEIAHQKAWDGFRGEAVVDGLRKMPDRELAAYLRSTAGTQYHPCSSCRMGVDDLSVVDSEGRVHEVDGLRVVDASILPAITSGNISCPTMMVAEKISDRVLGLPPLQNKWAT